MELTLIVDEISILYRYDEERYRNSSLTDLYDASEEQLLAYMMTVAHVIEKGLSNSGFELGHAFSVIESLADAIRIYLKKGYNREHQSYLNSLSCLKEFYVRHKGSEYEYEVSKILEDIIPEVLSDSSGLGGALEIKVNLKKNATKNFEELAKGRYSVREFADRPVDKKIIKGAIRIATKSPSACNRQAVKVRLILNKEIISEVLKVQGGVLDYPTPPVLMLIVADDSYFEGATQRNQGFIDGGLFAMSLLYALEYKGLAACPLNTCFSEVEEKTIRGMLDIPDKEKLIMFIEAGHFRTVNSVCKSFRYPAESLIQEITELQQDYKIDLLQDKLKDSAQDASDEFSIVDKPEKDRVNTGVKSSAILFLRAIKHAIRPRTRLKSVKAAIRPKTRIKSFLQTQKNKKKDGLIISLTDNTNYGNVLQRFALKQFLKKKGLDFDFLRLEPTIIDDSNKEALSEVLRFVKRHLDDVHYIPQLLYGYRNYIVGSDQVWRADFWRLFQDGRRPYFLEFLGRRRSNKIAYAASFGPTTLEAAGYDQEVITSVGSLLARFNAISVREQEGVKLVEQILGNVNKDVKCVPDPTLLLTREDYSKIIERQENIRDQKQPRVFAYFLHYENDVRMFIRRIAKEYFKSSYSVYYVGKTKNNSIEGWLKGFRDSEFVATDSFHGTIFSILHNKDFVVYIDPAQSVSRIKSLFSQLGINEERILYRGTKNNLDIKRFEAIDWTGVNKRLEELRREGGEWLLGALR